MKRHLVRLVPPIPGLWLTYTHRNCVCNDLISASNRVVGEVPLPTPAGIAMLRYERRRLADKYSGLIPLGLEETVQTFRGAKRRIYQMAYESLQTTPLWRKDGNIKAFVKAEKFDPEDKENPDPRMIQARSPRYNLVMASYLRKIEHLVYNLTKNGQRIVAKGLNAYDRAKLLEEKFASFKDPVCFSVDCSRWDKHVSLEVLQQEHAFYKSFYPDDPLLAEMLSWQQKNHCVTNNGVRYKVVGGRMSGDINTALGNVLLMVLMVMAAMRKLGITNYQIMNDGDDCLIIMERKDFAKVRKHLVSIFLEFGQELKIENISYDIHDVVFCQSKYTYTGTGYAMCRNWRKVLSQTCAGTKHWNDPHMVRPMMGLIGDCEVAMASGVPILQAYGQALQRNSRGLRAKITHMDSSYAYRVGLNIGEDIPTLPGLPISPMARLEFERTWGVPEWEQLRIEEILSTWTVDTVVAYDVPVELDSTWLPWYDPNVQIPAIY